MNFDEKAIDGAGVKALGGQGFKWAVDGVDAATVGMDEQVLVRRVGRHLFAVGGNAHDARLSQNVGGQRSGHIALIGGNACARWQISQQFLDRGAILEKGWPYLDGDRNTFGSPYPR